MSRRAVRLALLASLVLAALWSVPTVASAASNIEDVWCTSTAACVGVGASDASGSYGAQILRWDGEAWSEESEESVSLGEETVLSSLAGVTCTSASDCVAIGSAEDELEQKTPLVLRWDGTSWTTQAAPGPEGSIAAELDDVACASASSCIAVGSYYDQQEVKHALSMTWDGEAWSLRSVPEPTGAGLSELSAVSCVGSADCVGVGSFVNGSEVTKTLAVAWNGSAWSIDATPEPEGAELSQLEDISCRPSEACTAVGQYIHSGEEKTLALRRNTAGEWSLQATPNQAGALSRALTSVSCSGGAHCTAVGVVEQGRLELAVTIEWNGTEWSEQPIDTEALGATAVSLTAVHCLSASDCNATGSVSYGRSAARRNLAFHYNGTVWLVTEAGGYERRWTSVAVTQARRVLDDVSCPAEARCFAVGSLKTDDGQQKAQVASWGGGSWDAEAAPLPSEASAARLRGVSCASADDCWAVGGYVDAERQKHIFAMSWDGVAWSIETMPTPAEGSGAELWGVDCVTAGACTAVGSYLHETGNEVPLAMAFDGTEWSIEAVEAPAETPFVWLADLDCLAAGACMAVGAQADYFGHEQSFAVVRDESGWKIAETPTLEGNAPNRFEGVSCTSEWDCTTVGGFVDQEGREQIHALRWDGLGWLAMAQAGGFLATTGLSDVSCPAASDCVAVGRRPGESSQPPQIVRWDGTSWDAEPPAEYAVGASSIELRAVDCASAVECQVVGSAAYGGFGAKNMTLVYRAETWRTADTASPGGGLRGVSCVGGESCMAVGDSTEPAGNPATRWILGEDGWEVSSSEGPDGAYLTDVVCLEEADCLAVGRKGEWPFAPLAQRFDGETWTTQSPPAISGRSAQLQSVSCSKADWCVTAGFSWPDANAGPSAALAQSWDGAGWQTMSVPVPAAADSAMLHDVACTSASFCVAVGSYHDSEGASHGLIASWEGSAWSSSSLSPPSGERYALLGVDCTSATACTAVGTSTAYTDGTVVAIAARWNGTAWTTGSVPLPEGSDQSRLADVDCYSSTRCVAAGSHQNAAGRDLFLADWTSGTWTHEEAPTISGSDRAELASISCPSAADCAAVGTAQSSGALREPVAIETVGDPEREDPPPIFATEPPPTLTPEQEEQALAELAEDPSFQAAVGTAEYEVAAIGPWTESSEEGGGETIVGAYILVSLKEQQSWTERTWPAVAYPVNAEGYEGGTYSADSLKAEATKIEALQMRLDTEVDAEENIVGGEVVDMIPLPANPIASEEEPGDVEINPETVEEDKVEGGEY